MSWPYLDSGFSIIAVLFKRETEPIFEAGSRVPGNVEARGWSRQKRFETAEEAHNDECDCSLNYHNNRISCFPPFK